MSVAKDYVKEWYYRPLSKFSGNELFMLRRELTCWTKPFQRNEKPKAIPGFEEDVIPGYIGLPIDWAIKEYGSDFDDLTTEGVGGLVASKFPDPYHPKVLEKEKQAKFMSGIIESLENNYTTLAIASTGIGKTVCALNAIGRFGLKSLVLVHRTRLAHQWKKEAIDKLGLRPESVGIIGDGICEWEGKELVIGIYHTISKRNMPEKFYDHFGMVVYDEVHTIAAETFSKSLGLFPATYKLALTATEKRKDKCHYLYTNYFGDGQVRSEAKALRTKIIPVEYTGQKFSLEWGMPTMISHIANRLHRNVFIVKLIKKLYNKDRNILVVSDRVNQLKTIRKLCIEAGIKPHVIGLFVGGKSDAELEYILETSTITLATRGMVKEGIDNPKWDAGIDATPSSDDEQLNGRIKRYYPGKKKPVWLTILDVFTPKCMSMFDSRCVVYRKTNCEVVR